MAEGVERFEPAPVIPGGCPQIMETREEGTWVRYSDYEKLEAKSGRQGQNVGSLFKRARKAEAERDQARSQERQRIQEALLAEIHKRRNEQKHRIGMSSRDTELRAMHGATILQNLADFVAALDTLDPSGEEVEGDCDDLCTCGHERFHHDDGREMGVLTHCKAKACTCKQFRIPDPSGEEPEDCEECNGHGHGRIDYPGLEDYGVDPEQEPCVACNGTGKKPVSDPSGEEKPREAVERAWQESGRSADWPVVYVTRRKTASKEIGTPGYFNAYSLSAEPPDWPAFESRRYVPATDTSKEERSK